MGGHCNKFELRHHVYCFKNLRSKFRLTSRRDFLKSVVIAKSTIFVGAPGILTYMADIGIFVLKASNLDHTVQNTLERVVSRIA